MAEHARDRELFGDELVCTLRTPFALLPRDVDGVGDVARLVRRNLNLLRGAAMLDTDQDTAMSNDDDAPAWWRLEAKLDLVLEMMGALHRQNGGSDAIDLRSARLGVACELPIGVAAGPAIAAIELNALIPQPLQWPGTVVVGEAANGLVPIWLRFDAMPEALQSAWERHLFRHHRRTIATARRRG
jgi:hypothetical protein